MKAYLALVLLVAVAVEGKRRATRTRFEHGLEVIIDKMKNGDNDLPINLPSLRPLKIHPIKVKYLTLEIDVSEVTVDGLENLQVERVRGSRGNMNVDLAFSVAGSVVATADQYHLVGSAFGLVPIDDTGNLRVQVDNLNAVAKLNFGEDGRNTVVDSLDLDFSANVQVFLSGSNPVVNDLLNTMLKGLLADRDSLVFVKAKEIVVEMVNQYLKGYSPSELIRMVENEG